MTKSGTAVTDPQQSLTVHRAQERTIRVVLVDNHKTLRAGLRLFLQEKAGLMVTAEVPFSSDSLNSIQTIKPDIILLNLDRDDSSRRQVVEQMIIQNPDSRLMVLASDRELAFCFWALQSGAAGVVLKDQDGALLYKAIECVYAGEIWAERGLTAKLLNQVTDSRRKSPEDKKIDSLTEREREVVNLVGEGLKNRQIGERMFISETTVRHHLTSIFSKLGVVDRLSLVIYAYKYGLVTLPMQENQ